MINMATSFYVYDTLKEYKLRYGDKTNSEMFQTKIKDMYVTADEKLWVVTNFTEQAAKPHLNRSIVHFYAGEVAYYKKGDEKLIIDGKISYNAEAEVVEIFPRVLRKPTLFFRVGRFYGDKPVKTTKINYRYRYYDFTSNRINLILE